MAVNTIRNVQVNAFLLLFSLSVSKFGWLAMEIVACLKKRNAKKAIKNPVLINITGLTYRIHEGAF